MRKPKPTSIKHVFQLYAFIFVVWGFYRFLFKLPEEVEELILKPIIWLGPLIWVLYREKVGSPTKALATVGWTSRNLFKSIYLAIGIGILLAIEGAFINSIKYGSFNFLKENLTQSMLLGALGISFVTAISEETVFRGFIFNRLWKYLKSEWSANIITSVSWALVHLPVTVFVFRYTGEQILVFILLTFLFGVVSAIVYARTGNIVSSVLLHVFWEWPIILFR
ncbi:CPBP family intramembrane metalloprotease [Candidatus Microgenomates bacterium]|nr:CPBP family intramembrane metalloprotease [Candidatus Microgenomates bacterium]